MRFLSLDPEEIQHIHFPSSNFISISKGQASILNKFLPRLYLAAFRNQISNENDPSQNYTAEVLMWGQFAVHAHLDPNTVLTLLGF